MSARRTVRLILLMGMASLVLGCASQQPKENEFFNKWKEMAEESQGYSPDVSRETVEIGETVITGDELREQELEELRKQQRPLPRERVTLKLRNTDVRIILRTLAKAAGQNILVNSSVQGSLSVNIENTPWDQVFKGILRSQGLTYDWEGGIIRIMTVADMERDLKLESLEDQRQAQKLQRRQVEPLVTQVFKVSFADASDLKDNVAQMLTPAEGDTSRGSVVVDKHTNSLIVQAIRDDLSKVSKLVATLDTPRSQIQLKAHIVETTNDLARELGVQWGGVFKSPAWNNNRHLWVTPGGTDGSTQSDPVEGEYDPNLGTGISGQGFGSSFPASLGDNSGLNLGLLYGMIGDDILELQLSALQEDGKLNILSSPSITTLDNQMAFTENGERVPFETVDDDGRAVVEFEDAVLRLEITPHLIDREMLKLHVVVKKDEVDFSRTVAGNPVIIKKQTETNLIVQHGETIVISGLSRQRNIDSESGIPGLKDVPALGHLFKSNSKSEIMEEVLVFITPHVLQKRSDVATTRP